MHEIIKQWASRLRDVEVPVLQSTLSTLEAMHADDDVTPQMISDLVAADYGMTLNLLHMINSSNRAALSNEVYTIERLLMLKGIKGMTDFVKTLPVAEVVWSRERCQQWRQLTAVSYHRAMQAYHFSLWKQDFVPDEVFTGAYFHDLAEKLLFAAELSLDEPEKGLPEPDFSIDQLSLTLLEQWGVPLLVGDTLHLEKAVENRVLGILLATELVNHSQQSWYSEKMQECIKQVAIYVGFTENETVAWVHRVAAMSARNVKEYLDIASPWMDELIQIQREEGELLEEQPAQKVFVEGDSAVFQEAASTLISPRALKMTTPQLTDFTLEGMHRGLGIQRVVFAMLTPDGEALRAVQMKGSEHELGFNHFEVGVERDNLFGRVLDQKKAIWVTTENREKVMPLVPPKTLAVLHVDSFILVPVIVHDEAVGLFYADQGESSLNLTQEQYRGVAQLTNSFARVLGMRKGAI